MSGTGLENDLLLLHSAVNIDELYPNVVTLCGDGEHRIVGQVIKTSHVKRKSSHGDSVDEEIRTVKLANAIVSLGVGKGERFYRRLVIRLTW